MRQSATVERATGFARLLFLVLASSLVSACTYKHGRIHQDSHISHMWDSTENAIKRSADTLQPIRITRGSALDSIPFPDQVLPALYARLDSTPRHGAGDKRILSQVDGKGVSGSNIIAGVWLVRGSEYKALKDFRNGWLPIAVMRISSTKEPSRDPLIYKKRALPPGKSLIFVRLDTTTGMWRGALVSNFDGSPGQLKQDPLAVDVSPNDAIEPVLGARFMWEDNDESLWIYCAGNCCKPKLAL